MTTMTTRTASGRAFNFSAGPAVLPEAVLERAKTDIWDIFDTGIGVLEHSHRGKAFDRVMAEAEADCRELAGIPDNYRVLFLQGGASHQFFMVPANFLREGQTADYLNTGSWSKKAIKEAKRYGNAHVVCSSEDRNFNFIPPESARKYSKGAVYTHFTSNNTIFGTEFATEPEAPKDAPLICDASSDIFSRPIDVSKYGMIYAGAQKNLGPSGCVLVLIRDDLIEAGRDDLPTMLQYRTHSENDSRYNTPNTFAIYLMGRVFKWIKGEGGLAGMAERNAAKANALYDFLDASAFYAPTVIDKQSRSLMNVCFRCADESLEAKFISEAEAAGLKGLKGHRSVGGMRASIYNALPPEGVDALIAFMKEFERANA